MRKQIIEISKTYYVRVTYLMGLDSRTVNEKESKKTDIANNYKRQEVMVSYDDYHSERTLHIKEDIPQAHNFFINCDMTVTKPCVG